MYSEKGALESELVAVIGSDNAGFGPPMLTVPTVGKFVSRQFTGSIRPGFLGFYGFHNPLSFRIGVVFRDWKRPQKPENPSDGRPVSQRGRYGWSGQPVCRTSAPAGLATADDGAANN
jgi:hypothetical protein